MAYQSIRSAQPEIAIVPLNKLDHVDLTVDMAQKVPLGCRTEFEPF
jgi:hypothetical protein